MSASPAETQPPPADETVNANSEEVRRRLEVYYTSYYRDQLGLPDWSERVRNRLRETENIEGHIQLAAAYRNAPFARGEKVLVMGAGTGAELLAFARMGCEVVGVEPDAEACAIARLKFHNEGIDSVTIIQGPGEQLPFPAETFDFIWCHTVLEHVQDVKACISEMVRVLKTNARAYLTMPDYRHFYEPHYKLPLPMFLPKPVVAAILLLLGRPVRFLYSLNLVNTRKIVNILQDLPVVSMQVVSPWPDAWKRGRMKTGMRITKWIVQRLGYQRDQRWVLLKRGGQA